MSAPTSAPRSAAPADQSRVLLIMPLQDAAGEELLEKACGRVDRTGIEPEAITVALADADAVVLRGPGYLSAEQLDAAPHLRFISVSGAGYDCVDIAAATARGLPVLFYPGFSARPVAEWVLGALVVCSRRLGTADAACRRPDFDWTRRTTDLNGTLLHGASLGLVGLGRIGLIVANLAGAFGMEVTAYDPHTVDWPEGVARAEDLDALLATSDFVSLNAPLTDETRGMISRERIAAMKPGACLINAARGELLDEQAVAGALESGHLAFGAFDVFCSEPDVSASPLATARNAMVTPHIAGNSVNTTRATCVAIAETVISALNGTFDVARVVNGEVLTGASGGR
ncbi:MAG TPA: NAD(P)-dependent oxidoreductase [Amycolatopsis sp.]|nr:NAD(P)-dependent oxidoreductase [Amycolatopsis sp.]